MKNTAKVSASDLERQIFELEEVRVVIRASKNKLFDPYPYERKAAGTTSIKDWYETRLKPILEAEDDDADIIDGYGTTPHGRTQIEKIRNSYAEK